MVSFKTFAYLIILGAFSCSSSEQLDYGSIEDMSSQADLHERDGAADAGEDIPDKGIDLGTGDTGSKIEYGEMILIPAGRFLMGCDEEDNDICGYSCCDPLQQPRHEVTIKTFYIDKTEVTVAAYRQCVDDGVCPIGTGLNCNIEEPDRELHPMNCATFSHAQAFCSWAGKRLCSEAEWEKSARGGCEVNGDNFCEEQVRRFPWGNEEATCSFSVMSDSSQSPPNGCGTGRSFPVGSKPRGVSPYGAVDMSGNVYEFVSDCFHVGYEGAPTDGSSWEEPCASGQGMTKSGYFGNSVLFMSSWSRNSVFPGHESCCGIRCCSDQPM